MNCRAGKGTLRVIQSHPGQGGPLWELNSQPENSTTELSSSITTPVWVVLSHWPLGHKLGLRGGRCIPQIQEWLHPSCLFPGSWSTASQPAGRQIRASTLRRTKSPARLHTTKPLFCNNVQDWLLKGEAPNTHTHMSTRSLAARHVVKV